jgi:hypothetical protein
MPEFGMPSFIRPQNINVPHRKGFRRIQHLSEDSQRDLGVPKEEFDRKYEATNWAEPVAGDLVQVTERKRGRLVIKRVAAVQ